jgi:hypothetical protein
MRGWILALLAVALLALVLRRTTEHMTNDDVVAAMKTFGGPAPTKKKKVSGEKDEIPIYGPRGVEAPPQPKPAPSKPGAHGTSNYPEIFGPDVIFAPGKKVQNGKEQSDAVSDETYDFNPDLRNAFPTSGEPQPFLADFSKFQR